MDDIEQEYAELVVLGGGPGGYPAAFAAADRGMSVVLVDEGPQPGGVCLHRGCIPSKTLLHAAKLMNEANQAAEWGITFGRPQIDLDKLRGWKTAVVERLTAGVSQLCKSRGVRLIPARGRFRNSESLELTDHQDRVSTLSFQHAIIATGSSPALPAVFDIGDPRVMDSTAALELEEIPNRLLIVGGGYIGLEMGTVYAALGSQVTLVEMTPGLLPGTDRDLVHPLLKRLKTSFEAIHLNTKVERLTAEQDGVVADLRGNGNSQQQIYDRVLAAVGRTPNSQNIGLEQTQVEVDEQGFILVNEQRRTADSRLLAIGDVTGVPMLAHKATHDAKVAAAALAGEPASFNRAVIPAVVFTDPELAWCGLSETEAKLSGQAVKALRYPWAASSRAQTLGQTDGLTKLLFDPQTDRLLGMGVVGPHAGELIAEGALAVESAATARDLAHVVHPHPTLSETIMEAAEMYLGTSTHLYRPRR